MASTLCSMCTLDRSLNLLTKTFQMLHPRRVYRLCESHARHTNVDNIYSSLWSLLYILSRLIWRIKEIWEKSWCQELSRVIDCLTCTETLFKQNKMFYFVLKKSIFDKSNETKTIKWFGYLRSYLFRRPYL